MRDKRGASGRRGRVIARGVWLLASAVIATTVATGIAWSVNSPAEDLGSALGNVDTTIPRPPLHPIPPSADAVLRPAPTGTRSPVSASDASTLLAKVKTERVQSGQRAAEVQLAGLARQSGKSQDVLRGPAAVAVSLAQPLPWTMLRGLDTGSVFPLETETVDVYWETVSGYPYHLSAPLGSDQVAALADRVSHDVAALRGQLAADARSAQHPEDSLAMTRLADDLAASQSQIRDRLVVVGFTMPLVAYERQAVVLGARLPVAVAEVMESPGDTHPFFTGTSPLNDSTVTSARSSWATRLGVKR